MTGTQALPMDDVDNSVTANGTRRNEHDTTTTATATVG